MNHRQLIAALTPLHGAGEARAIVRMVMEERFHLTQTDLLLGKDTELSSTDLAELEKIAHQLLTGAPVQHVLGYADFCGLRFRVTPDVLIPRPETSELVRWAIDTLQAVTPLATDTPKRHVFTPFSLIDFCTGSGCIAITLALTFPQAHVLAVDISDAALDVARHNAAVMGATNVTFLQQDILQSSCAAEGSPQSYFDDVCSSLIIANPPYVRQSEASDIVPTVLDHEPSIALFVPDDDPLCFYRAIARIARQRLATDGFVMTELNAALAEPTRKLFIEEGYTDVTLRDDQFGRPRFLRARAANRSCH